MGEENIHEGMRTHHFGRSVLGWIDADQNDVRFLGELKRSPRSTDIYRTHSFGRRQLERRFHSSIETKGYFEEVPKGEC